MIFADNLESNVVQDEAERLVKEIKLMMNNVEMSKVYKKMHKELKNNKIIQQHFSRIIDSDLNVEVVIFGLGSIGYSFNSQFHLAVVLLLKRDFSSWIGELELHGTEMSSADIVASQKLGLTVFTSDENCKRKAQRPTMFFMPNPLCRFIGNVLGENWSCLDKIILLTISCHGIFKAGLYIDDRNNLESMLRLEKILQFTEEIDIETDNDEKYEDVFSGYAWHFFNVDAIDPIYMEKLEHCSLLRKRYREFIKKSGTQEAREEMMSDAEDAEELIEAIKQEVKSDAEKLSEGIKRTINFGGETSEGDLTTEDTVSNADFHIGDHVEKLVEKLCERIMRTMEHVQTCNFYAEMTTVINTDKFQNHLSHVLGSCSQIQVVIYSLGSVEYLYDSRLQLATVLRLRKDFPRWIGNIEVYDPIMSTVDTLICKKLGIEVLTINEDCKRTAQRPTMFYMPYPHHFLIGNLLGANWSSSCLNRIILLTESLHGSFNILLLEDPKNLETMIRLQKILKFTTEFDTKRSEEESAWNVEFVWHFFDVDTNFEIDSGKPGYYWFDMQRYLETTVLSVTESNVTNKTIAAYLSYYRMPRHVRWNSVPLSPGWFKLNIYGIGKKGNQQGKYCCVLQNKGGDCFRTYNGYTNVEDDVIAGLEALKVGLNAFQEITTHGGKLIVESDNVMLVQYVNGRPEPNKKTKQRLNKMFKLLGCITCAVY